MVQTLSTDFHRLCQNVNRRNELFLTSLSGFVAHSSESRGDLDIMVAFVCIMGLKDQTFTTPSTSRLATFLPELSTLFKKQSIVC